MNKTTLHLGIILLLLTTLLGCQQSDNGGYARQEDFFQNKKYAGDYCKSLPLNSIDSTLARIKAEVPPHWYGAALEGAYYNMPEMSDSALFGCLDKYEKEFPHDSVRAFCQLMRGHLLTYHLEFDTADKCLQNCYDISIRDNRLTRANDALFYRGAILVKRSDYPEGIAMITQASQYFEQLLPDDGGRFRETLTTLGGTARLREDYEDARYWYQRTIAYLDRYSVDDPFRIQILSGLGYNYKDLGRLDSAKIFVDSALVLEKKYHYTYETGMRSYERAEVYTALGRCAEAMPDYWLAARNPDFQEIPLQLAKFKRGLANGYFCLGQLDSAAFFYQQALVLSDTISQAGIYGQLAKVYEQKHQLDRALAYERQGTALHEHTITIAKERKIARLQAQNEAQSRIKAAEYQRKVTQYWVVLMSLLFAFGTIFTIHYIRRNQRKQKYLEQKKALAEAENTIAAVNLVQAEKVVVQQAEDLAVSAQKLRLKEELIEKLELRLSVETEAERITDDEGVLPSDAHSNTPFRGLRLLTAEDWLQFKDIFDQYFPNFMRQLKTQYPQLTASEVRLLMLMKADFEAPEIAHITGTLTTSIYTSRYRLRRKLGIEKDAQLEVFVQSLDPSV